MKTQLSRSINYLLFMSLFFLFSGCQKISMHGHSIDPEVIQTIRNNKYTKDQVMEIAGSPEVVSENDVNKWYYIERKTLSSIFLSPKVIEQKVAEIIFDRNNKVQDVNILQDTHIDQIKVLPDLTPTKGNEQNLLQHYLKNMGKFSKFKNKKVRKKD